MNGSAYEEDCDGFKIGVLKNKSTLASKLKGKNTILKHLHFASNVSPEVKYSLVKHIYLSLNSYQLKKNRVKAVLQNSDRQITQGLSKSFDPKNNKVNSLYFENGEQAEGKENCEDSMPQRKPKKPVESTSVNHSEPSSTATVKCSEDSSKKEDCEIKEDGSKKEEFKSNFTNPAENTLVKRLLHKAKHSHKKQQKQKEQVGRNVKKKLQRGYHCSKPKSKFLSKKENDSMDKVSSKKTVRHSLPNSPTHQKKSDAEIANKTDNRDVHSESEMLVSPRLKQHSVVLGRKKFVLPIVSARSARKIIPRKRYLDEIEIPVSSNKKKCHLDENSPAATDQASETSKVKPKKSAIVNGKVSHAKEAQQGQQKRTGLLDQPLVTEGKRTWKPSPKIQSKISEKNGNSTCNMKKTVSAALETDCSSESFKDVIKPDMVSKYADQMAQKPKERNLKNPDSKKISQESPSPLIVPKKESFCDRDGKKSADQLEKVAAKIEKILKSQWEGRLNHTTSQSHRKTERSSTMKVKTSPLSQWKNEQEQRASNQKRTKSIIRKARLQLKKRTLMKLRQPQSIALLKEQIGQSENATSLGAIEKKQSISSPSRVELVSPEQKPLVSAPITQSLTTKCCICEIPMNYAVVQKFYGKQSCEICSRFFGNFIESPKQYFCSKDGSCASQYAVSKDSKSVKVSNVRYRCKACWLKVCMQEYTLSEFLHEQLQCYVPRLEAPPHTSLIEDKEATNDLSENIPESVSDNSSVNQPVSSELPSVNSNSVGEVDVLKSEDKPSVDKDVTIEDEELVCKSETGILEPVPSSTVDLPASQPTKSSPCVKNEAPASCSPSRKMDSICDSNKPNSDSKTSLTICSSISDTAVLKENDEQKSGAASSVLLQPDDSKESAKAHGPRIKHVCRRAAVVLGLPKAKFSAPETDKHFSLSALPKKEKRKILESEAGEPCQTGETSKSSNVLKSVSSSCHETKTKLSVGISKKSTLTVHKKQKKKKLLMKSYKHIHKQTTFKKPIKLTHKVMIKNQLKYSYKTLNKSSVKTVSSPSKNATNVPKFRKVRCRQCEGCLAEDCGRCNYCL